MAGSPKVRKATDFPSFRSVSYTHLAFWSTGLISFIFSASSRSSSSIFSAFLLFLICQAFFQESFCHFRLRIKIQVRITTHKMIVCHDTFPVCLAHRLLRVEAVSGIFAVPVVELVRRKTLSFFAEQVVLEMCIRDRPDRTSAR